MPDTLLLTKLYIPPPNPSVIPRQELSQLLHAGLQGRLTMVTAPPGFGKTTLLSESLRKRRLLAAWFSIDAGDNDLVGFFRYVVAALQRIDERIGPGVTVLLRSPGVPTIQALVAALINEIAVLDTAFVLVLDDFHNVDDPPVLQAVELLVERQPPQMHLVIAGRRNPLLPTARLRARGWMTEIRTDDLRFDTREATVYMNRIMGLGLDQEEITALIARTEGWIAGLQLAALSLKGYTDKADRSEFVRVFAGDDRYVMDYLISEVLSRQSDDMKKFLIRTAVLKRFCSSLCDAVVYGGEPPGRSQGMLEYLDRAHLFIVPLDNKRQWYRYHHLFADLLRHRLMQSRAVRIPELHQRASEWYGHNGFTDQAVQHALAAGDHERAAALVESIAMKLVAAGRLAKLLGWVRELPEEVAARHPWLCTGSAWASLLSGRLEAVKSFLSSVESLLDAGAATDADRLRCHVLAVRAFSARWRGEVELSIRISREALMCLPREDRVVRSALALNLGSAYMQSGSLSEAEPYFKQAGEAGPESAHIALNATQHLADIQVLRGHLHGGVAIHRKALQLGIEWGNGQALPATGYPYLGLGEILYQWNDLEQAAEQFSLGIELARQADDPFMEFEGRLARARLRRALGARDSISELLEWVAEVGCRVDRIEESSQLAALEAESLLLQGGLAAVKQWVGERNHYLEGELVYTKAHEYRMFVGLLIALGRSDDALSLLSRLQQAADANGRTGDVIRILAQKAIAHDTLDRGERAMAALQRALALAEPEGYIRIFVDEGPIMARLLSEAGKAGIAPEYAGRLLAAFTDNGGAKAPGGLQTAEGLSRRELEVLRLLDTEMSGPEIANALYVALSTIRTHTKRIYGKLYVTSRQSAVRRAKELNLL